MSEPPIVFISHSIADKERFVIPFAEQLRKDGVNAWVAGWEIKPGDSLVDKIFNEGIGKAKYAIFVISENSMKSSWVKEELDSAMVRKINGKCQIIPIIIDNCSIPIAFEHLYQVKIDNLTNYENKYKDLLLLFFGQTSKPPLGNQPNFPKSVNLPISGLSKVDLWILESLCKFSLSSDCLIIESKEKFIRNAKDSGFTDEQITDSLTILNDHGYITGVLLLSGKLSSIQVSTHSLDIYCRQNVNNYENLELSVISSIVNNNKLLSTEISVAIDAPTCFVIQILNYLTFCGKINSSIMGDGSVRVHQSNFAELKRMLI
jgi:hypothetical protein